MLVFFLSSISLDRKTTYLKQMLPPANDRLRKNIIIVDLEAGLGDRLPPSLSELPRVGYEDGDIERQAITLMAKLGLETPASQPRRVHSESD